MSRTFGYARVSRQDLTTDNQRIEIEAAGFAIDPRRFVVEAIRLSASISTAAVRQTR